MTGGSGGERMLHDLEQGGAFVASLDAPRSWFRYHRLFAGLLQLQLRRTAPDEVVVLHELAAGWFAEHGFAVEAVRHAQAAQDWGLAARLLADHWPGLHLDGRAATVHALLAGFPAEAPAADAELAAVAAADELARGSLEAAERYLGLAERGSAAVPAARRGQAQVLLGLVRLLLARQRGNLPAVAEQAQRLQAAAEAAEAARGMAQYDLAPAARAGLGEELRALALVSLGVTEFLAGGFENVDQRHLFEAAERHLEQGVALARRIGRPYLEFIGLAYQAVTKVIPLVLQAGERAGQAIELAEQHGWTDGPTAGYAYALRGVALIWQGRPEEAEPWAQRAERTLRPEAEPTVALLIHHIRGQLELARGRDADALAAFQAAERLVGRLAAPHLLVPSARALVLYTLVRLGETERAEQVLADLSDQDREHGEMVIAAAALRLAQDDPYAAAAALGPVLDGPALQIRRSWLIQAFVLEAIARDTLGDPAAADLAVERALDLAKPDGAFLPFLLHPAPALLERHARQRTAHAALIAQILDLLAGNRPAPPPAGPRPPLERLSNSEIRVLRYLPTHLTAPEIASELSVSLATVKTHLRNLYAKLGAHSRAEAVESARALGLLAPSARSPAPS
jgi:LuxR family transcriptional regulator, maltose regulon positive regulatory protein